MDSTSFTALATIFIPVLLSVSIALRSYILRRRYRQRYQQAFNDGLLVGLDRSTFDPLGEFRRPPLRRLPPKPVLWDTWIHPVDKNHTWSSITPVSGCCTSSLSPSTPISLPQLPIAPLGSQSPEVRPHPFFSQRRPSSSYSSSRPSPPLSRQAYTSPTVPSIRSPPLGQPGSSDSSTHTGKDAAIFAVCVLVAMPDASVPVNFPAPNPGCKSVGPLDPLADQQSGNVVPLSPSSLRRPSPRPDFPTELPLLEFGVVKVRTGGCIWTT